MNFVHYDRKGSREHKTDVYKIQIQFFFLYKINFPLLDIYFTLIYQQWRENRRLLWRLNERSRRVPGLGTGLHYPRRRYQTYLVPC